MNGCARSGALAVVAERKVRATKKEVVTRGWRGQGVRKSSWNRWSVSKTLKEDHGKQQVEERAGLERLLKNPEEPLA